MPRGHFAVTYTRHLPVSAIDSTSKCTRAPVRLRVTIPLGEIRALVRSFFGSSVLPRPVSASASTLSSSNLSVWSSNQKEKNRAENEGVAVESRRSVLRSRRSENTRANAQGTRPPGAIQKERAFKNSPATFWLLDYLPHSDDDLTVGITPGSNLHRSSATAAS